jgi:glycosyltransferase involved in cell wall biosynthesis
MPFSVPSLSPSSCSDGQPLTLLFALATVLPLLDAVVIVSRIGVGQELLRHAAILFVLAIVSLSLWRSTRSQSPE